MTKRILIITSSSGKTINWKERERYVRDFCANVEHQLSDVSVNYTTYDDLQFKIVDGVSSIYDTHNGFDLKEVQFVHFKNWTFEPEEASTAALYLRINNIPFLNTEVDTFLASGKLSQMFYLAEAKVPVPDTFYGRKPLLKKIFASQQLPQGFSFPLIIKSKDASMGDDNHLVKSIEKAMEVLTHTKDPETEYLLQNFIPNDGDYRFLFIGIDTEPLIFHRKSVSGTHLNNTSKGAEGKFVDITTLPKEYLQYAFRAAQILRREIGGVDILVNNKTSRAYVLEVNSTPALATGYGVETKTKKFAQFIEAFIEVQEEE